MDDIYVYFDFLMDDVFCLFFVFFLSRYLSGYNFRSLSLPSEEVRRDGEERKEVVITFTTTKKRNDDDSYSFDLSTLPFTPIRAI